MSESSKREASALHGLPDKPGGLYAVLVLLGIGLIVAIYLVGLKLDIAFDPNYESSCNYGEGFDCDAVNTSEWSAFLGLPISLFAIPTYLVMAYLVWLGLRGRHVAASKETEAIGARALTAASGIGLIISLHAIFLFIISKTQIGSICLYCSMLYGVNILSALLLVRSGPKNLGNAIRGSFGLLAGRAQPFWPAVGVTFIAFGIAWAFYDHRAVAMEASYEATMRAQIDAQYGSTPGAAPAASPTVAGAAPATASAQGGAGQAAPAPVRATPAPPQPKRVRPSTPQPRKKLDLSSIKRGNKTKDGYAYFEVPLDEDSEFFYGNPDAPVTVVKFADFQCAYCGHLARTMKPVKEKWKDKVRFVMKQFPMNPKCNRIMQGYDKHPNACEAAYAGHCAGMQGKFWEMHDAMYADQNALDIESLRSKARDLGLDMAKFEQCMGSEDTKAAIAQDIEIAIRAGIYGTPRTYIHHRLVSGSATPAILNYHIEKALEAAERGQGAAQPAAAAVVTQAPKPVAGAMVAVKTAKGTSYIDAYEAAVTKDGEAVTLPGVKPAQVSWFDAKAACEKAGKRLCTEEEWVSACTGKPAVDNNGNGWFSDDSVEGNMYPYGAFYEAGVCHDQGDKYEGRPVATGSKERCRTVQGIYDLAGNIGEWVNDTENKATTMGGYASTGERAACNQRSYGSGAGRTNHTTGFRCCADRPIGQQKVDPSDLEQPVGSLMGQPVPELQAKTADGKTISTSAFKGKVTLVNFFASWCGPCKKEFPFLRKFQEELGPKGFQVVAFGTDGQAERSLDFAKQFDANFTIVPDTESIAMGKFRVYSMPATFLVDRKGVIRYTDTGFKPEEQAAKLRRAIEGLL